ncbi:MAG: hypothetical protein J6Q60_03615 [Bacteroidaceae bacterium]|nr:hypothetical protein [Bacteroidaceae bacterium]
MLSKLSYADIVATIALVWSFILFAYNYFSSKRNEKKFEEQTKTINDFKNAYQNHLDAEKKEKEENIRGLQESIKQSQKFMNDYFKREQERLGL